jgi:hypothetical protein
MTGGPSGEIALAGGMGSGGAVVRVGDTVRRPVRPHTDTVEAFLRHLADAGFTGAPRPLGRDEQGRQVLSWVEGDVAVPPFPAWAAAHTVLVGVADLQRRMHDAARGFAAPPDAVWDRANLPPAQPGQIVCHNDLCVENVVVRDAHVVGFIDFDFAAPSDPLLDIAIACRHWVPLRDPVDTDPEWQGVDRVARFRQFCDVHGLSLPQRGLVVEHALAFLDRALVSMRARAESGQPLYAAAWNGGYPQQNRRSHLWVATHLRGAAR